MDKLETEKQVCYLFRWNHFDPIWRRCWDRDFINDGRRYVSYRRIEEAWIDDALASTEDGSSCFMIESSWVLRHYLESHPEHAGRFRKLSQEGRFELLGAGENIVESNMINGELLARNLVLGTLWSEQVLGARPIIGYYTDGFGSSAQLPQIFRQCGYRWMPRLNYVLPDAPYWRGLDGSILLFEIPGKIAYHGGSASLLFYKYPPCAECRGEGCEVCQFRGIHGKERMEFTNPPEKRFSAEIGVVHLLAEELLPGMRVAEDISAFNETSNELHLRQGLFRDLLPYIEQELACIDAPPFENVSLRMENNAALTGCYVTRIRLKQRHREAEQLLLSTERWDALLGGGCPDTLRGVWRSMTLSAFHDAITATHIDEAYDELMVLLDDVFSTLKALRSRILEKWVKSTEYRYTVFNHEAFPVSATVSLPIPIHWEGAAASTGGKSLPVYELREEGVRKEIVCLASDIPALGAMTIKLNETSRVSQSLTDRTIRFGGFTIEVGDHGITGLTFDGYGPVIDTSRYVLAEPVIEEDFGSPWATLTLDRNRKRLASAAKLTGIVQHGDSLVITYEGNYKDHDARSHAMITILTWKQQFVFRRGLPWIDIQTNVEWYTHSRRLRLAFPSVTQQNDGVYEIPYGVMERERYEPTKKINEQEVRSGVDESWSACGDWPAIHWAGIQTPDYTFAVFNRGTPSYRVEDGIVFVSVLRSPQLPWYLHEPQHYTTYNYHGMMDHGTHTFNHAFYIGRGHWKENDVARKALLFNAQLAIQPGELDADLPQWKLSAEHTLLTVIKTAEDGNGIIIRLVEQSGIPEQVTIEPPSEYELGYITNLLEDVEQQLEKDGERFVVGILPWKIVTLRFVNRS